MRSPARKLKKSPVKNIVRFPAIKANGGKTILVESLLESHYCIHLEFDPNVATYFPQPKTFQIPGEDEESSYTPDFEVHSVVGDRCYVEVKPLKRSLSEHYCQLFDRFESSLVDTNYAFLLVDEVEVYQQPLFSNYEKLYRYRKRPTLDMRNLHSCAASIHGPVPLSWLVAKLEAQASLREIYSWIALGYLNFDIATIPLDMNTEVTFRVD